jgi:sigma-B regulation protein RsbU (phosphoserine phosphatase)
MLPAVVIGLVLGVLAMAIPIRRMRREIDRREEANQQLAQDRSRVIEFMHLMAEALGEGLTLQELRQRIVHASILCTGALSACIFEETASGTMRGIAVEGLFPPHRPIPDEVRSRLTTRAKFIEQVLKSEEFPVGEGIVGRVAGTGRAELVEDAAADPRVVRHDDPALAVRSVIAVPLSFRGRSFGVLAVANPADERAFTEAEFSLMQSLAEQAALALHNAEFLNLQIEKKRLDMDLAIASGIQQMLLPRQTVAVPGLDLAARYLPAQQVGGDLYDFIALPGRRMGLVVADVSGKGIAASLLMAITRTALRQIAPREDSPARVLSLLNRAVMPDMRGGLYVTLLYAVIDVGAGTVTFARAGHELPLFARRDRSGVYQTRFVGSEGMSVGMVPDDLFSAVIADRTEPFAPGDVLVLYTDGVTEAPNEEQKEYSGARLADALRALRGGSARDITDGILDSVRRFGGDAPQRDDLTLVTVKNMGPSGHSEPA